MEHELVRLDKLLAERGAGSRKDVDRMIRRGLVELDGEVVGKAGAKLKVPWSSVPIVDGFDYPPPPLLVAYHKPLGVVSSMRDNHNRADLSSVLPLPWQKLLHPVGRLDADTTGLLLFCRDGDVTHRLLHPKYVVEREYVAEVDNDIEEARLRSMLAAGVETIEDGESLIVTAELLSVDGQSVRLVVTEGKYRMVRRVLANCGHPVRALHRMRYGEVRLDELQIEQGDSIAIEGAALEWACALKDLKAPVAEPAHAAKGEAVGASHEQREDGAALDSVPRRVAGAVRDVNEAMADAWMPRAKDVRLVMEEAGVSKAEAVEALRRHEGDIVKALLDV